MAKETVNEKEEKEEKGGKGDPAPAFDAGENADLLIAAAYEMHLIAGNLLDYIKANDASGVVSGFAPGQLLRIQALSDVIHGAIEPEILGGDEPENLRKKVFG